MSRFLQFLLFACFAVALCSAEAPRYRQQQQKVARLQTARLQAPRRRFTLLARQELEEAAVTPYPTAKELKPEVPFEEAAVPAEAPTENPADDESPAAPAPGVESGSDIASLPIPAPGAQPDEADDAAEGEHEPDLIYGPPEFEDAAPEQGNEVAADVPAEEIEATVAEEEENAAAAEEEQRLERLVLLRRLAARKSNRPAKLRAAPKKVRAAKLRAARLQAVPQQQQFLAAQQQPIIYYMSPYQMW